MHTEQFFDHRDAFRVLDLVAWLNFKTQSSISFTIGYIGESPNELFQQGWLDVHYLPQEHVKYQIRGRVPEKYLERPKLHQLIQDLFSALKVAHDETYEAFFFTAAEVCCVFRVEDRFGNSDRFID